MNLQKLVLESEEVLLAEFSIKPEKSVYQVHSDNKWFEFVKKTGSHSDSQGVYLPRTLSAHLKKTSEYLQVNFFHEYFGRHCLIFSTYAIPYEMQ